MAASAAVSPPSRPGPVVELAQPPRKAARAAGLRYVRAEEPGIARRRAGGGFTYLDASGRAVRDPETLRRIKSLAIPPAWTDVWICADEHGHVQATGRDARGRKQYRYHPAWRRTRDETKYARMLAFADALPRIRTRVERDLRAAGLGRKKVLATIVSLLERTMMRVGNEEYAKSNGSYGLTTLRDRHAEVKGGKLRLSFRGKAGKRHQVDVEDPRIARIVKRCQDLPGQELFQYEDEAGEARSIGSADVNDYLREVSGEDFTAKDFRTWSGTVLAALALEEMESFDTKAQAKRNVVRAIERVAEELGNTPAVCRKCYVHPEVVDAYLDGDLLENLRAHVEREANEMGLDPDEAAVVALLRRRLAADASGSTAARRRSSRPHDRKKASVGKPRSRRTTRQAGKRTKRDIP